MFRKRAAQLAGQWPLVMAKSESQVSTTVAVRGLGRVNAHVECPITTAECASAQEMSIDALPELRYITHWPWPGHPRPVYDREVGFFVGPVLNHSCYACNCRAYKLGKRRWSYNQCELVLHQDEACGSGKTLVAVGAFCKRESGSKEHSLDGQVGEALQHPLMTC